MESFDLVLLDIMMPEIDGYEPLRQLKENPKCQDLPVIFITSLAEVEDETKGLELGAVDYIAKPFNRGLVKLRVKTHLALKKNRALLEQRTRELEKSLENVKLLSGMLPICASCKKIRDDAGYWKQIEIYISEHSDAQFTHGICPDCAHSLYPELYPKGWGFVSPPGDFLKYGLLFKKALQVFPA